MTHRQLFLLVLLLCALAFTTVHAQDGQSSGSLRVPSADEYMRAVPPLLVQAWADGDSKAGIAFARVVSDEIIYRYFPKSPSVDFSLLQTTYVKLIGAGGAHSSDLKPWHAIMIQTWLNENGIDLNITREIPFDDDDQQYTITVIPQDFDDDGQPEWILEITEIGKGSSEQTNYLVAKQVDGQLGSYQIIQTPIPWFRSLFPDSPGSVATWYLQDITGDGQLDWLLTVGAVFARPAGGFHFNYGWLEVLTWRQGQLVSLVPNETIQYKAPSGGGLTIIPHGISLHLIKSPNQRALQISVRKDIVDGSMGESRS